MADLETPRFPDSVSAGSKFGPQYSTNVARNFGGKTARNKNWTYPLHVGDVSTGIKSQADLDNLLTFFHRAAGQYDAWRFKNWNDFDASGSEGILTVITADTTWQMYKRHTYGAATGDIIVQKPVSGTISVAGGGSYTIDYATGIITKTSGANPTSWTGEFDFRCIFTVDHMVPPWLSFELYECEPFPIIEDRI